MEIFNATNLLYIWGGFVKTIEISALSIFFSLIFGTVLALVKSYAPRPFRILVSAYIELFRCTPNLLWILFIYFTVQGIDIVVQPSLGCGICDKFRCTTKARTMIGHH